MESSILGLLGLANRARLIRGGAVAVKESIRNGKAYLVILAADASPGTKRWVNRLAELHAVPVLEQHTRNELGASLDKAPIAAISVVNRHFADGILKKTGVQPPSDKEKSKGGGNSRHGKKTHIRNSKAV